MRANLPVWLFVSLLVSAPLLAAEPWQQILVVQQDPKNSVHGTISLYEKTNAMWLRTLGPLPALLGKRGIAWGRGPTFAPPQQAKIKREGDGKTPAGFFSIGMLFGYAPRPPVATRLPYTQITRHLYAISDPNSKYYNHAVDTRKVQKDWDAAGPMARTDRLYPWLLEIAHNQERAKHGAGSWIYLHPWVSRSTPTEGCTAVSPADFTRIIARLDPVRRPHIAVVPSDRHGTNMLAMLGIKTDALLLAAATKYSASEKTNHKIEQTQINGFGQTAGDFQAFGKSAINLLMELIPPTHYPVLYPSFNTNTQPAQGISQ